MLRGVLCVITASLLFGITPLGNKYVLLSGMQSDCVLLYQAFVMMAGTFLVTVLEKKPLRIPVRDALTLMALGAVGMGGTDYLLNLAYSRLPVSTVIMLHFLYPALVLLASVLFFRARFSRTALCAMLLSLAGLLLVTDFGGGMDLLGALFAFGSGAAYAFYVISNDYGSVNRYSLLLKLHYVSWGVLLVFAVKTLASGHFSVPADGRTLLVLVGLVGIGSLLGFYFITAGVKYIGASKTAFLNMLEPITATLGGVLLYHEHIALRSAAGCVCVLLSVLLISLDRAGAAAGEKKA